MQNRIKKKKNYKPEWKGLKGNLKEKKILIGIIKLLKKYGLEIKINRQYHSYRWDWEHWAAIEFLSSEMSFIYKYWWFINWSNEYGSK